MKKTVVLWSAGFALLAIALWLTFAWLNGQSADELPGAVKLKVQLQGAKDFASLVRNNDGTYSYVVMGLDGSREMLTPHDFADRVHRQQSPRTWLDVLFNISSPTGIIWVGLGLLGQLMFTGRMLVQWFISEKSKKSVVPPIFWWLSIVGAMMLLAYFFWRRDLVGVIGQAFGLAIYARNIHLIWRARSITEASTA